MINLFGAVDGLLNQNLGANFVTNGKLETSPI